MKPPIYDAGRFALRPYAASDERRFLEMMIDPVSTAFMGGATGDENDERRLFYKVLDEIYPDEASARWFWIWGIFSGDELVGHFELKQTEHTAADELEIVYVIHPEARRRGVMSEVLRFFKENQSLWKKRIIATVSPKNENSLKLLENWGIEKREVLTDEETGENYYKFILSSA